MTIAAPTHVDLEALGRLILELESAEASQKWVRRRTERLTYEDERVVSREVELQIDLADWHQQLLACNGSEPNVPIPIQSTGIAQKTTVEIFDEHGNRVPYLNSQVERETIRNGLRSQLRSLFEDEKKDDALLGRRRKFTVPTNEALDSFLREGMAFTPSGESPRWRKRFEQIFDLPPIEEKEWGTTLPAMLYPLSRERRVKAMELPGLWGQKQMLLALLKIDMLDQTHVIRFRCEQEIRRTPGSGSEQGRNRLLFALKRLVTAPLRWITHPAHLLWMKILPQEWMKRRQKKAGGKRGRSRRSYWTVFKHVALGSLSWSTSMEMSSANRTASLHVHAVAAPGFKVVDPGLWVERSHDVVHGGHWIHGESGHRSTHIVYHPDVSTRARDDRSSVFFNLSLYSHRSGLLSESGAASLLVGVVLLIFTFRLEFVHFNTAGVVFDSPFAAALLLFIPVFLSAIAVYKENVRIAASAIAWLRFWLFIQFVATILAAMPFTFRLQSGPAEVLWYVAASAGWLACLRVIAVAVHHSWRVSDVAVQLRVVRRRWENKEPMKKWNNELMQRMKIAEQRRQQADTARDLANVAEEAYNKAYENLHKAIEAARQLPETSTELSGSLTKAQELTERLESGHSDGGANQAASPDL